jgi:uracil-DNA glycosylase family protein
MAAAGAGRRELNAMATRQGSVSAPGAQRFLPERHSLPALRSAVRSCRGCELYRDTTQAVFGEGSARARLMMIGEQPGDREDLQGEPFVGPAGHLLDAVLAAAGIERAQTYLTNAVKHFAFTRAERGKRRIHRTPGRTEVVACWPWLAAEFEAVRPELVVCLGATAAQALYGSSFRLTAHRGEPLSPPESLPVDTVRTVVVTVHPSAVLRAPDREQAREGLVADLRVAAGQLPSKG